MIFVRWICLALALIYTAWIIPGISINSFLTAMLAAVVIALINAFLKPLLQLITLPINLVTLGLFTLVINALLFMLAGWITPGLIVDGFWSAFLGSIVFSLLSLGISKIGDNA